MPEFAALAQRIDGRRRHTQALRGLADAEQGWEEGGKALEPRLGSRGGPAPVRHGLRADVLGLRHPLEAQPAAARVLPAADDAGAAQGPLKDGLECTSRESIAPEA